MKFRRLVSSLMTVAVVGFAQSIAFAGEAEDVAKASAAAKEWLGLTDAGKYAESWDAAAAAFKAAVTKAQWGDALNQVRKPLAANKSRELLKSAAPLSVTAGPSGEYVAIRYTAKFENGPDIIETVAPMREKDGSWKVSGYYLAPAPAPAATPAPAPAPTTPAPAASSK
jgi:hypothetical protein